MNKHCQIIVPTKDSVNVYSYDIKEKKCVLKMSIDKILETFQELSFGYAIYGKEITSVYSFSGELKYQKERKIVENSCYFVNGINGTSSLDIAFFYTGIPGIYQIINMKTGEDILEFKGISLPIQVGTKNLFAKREDNIIYELIITSEHKYEFVEKCKIKFTAFDSLEGLNKIYEIDKKKDIYGFLFSTRLVIAKLFSLKIFYSVYTSSVIVLDSKNILIELGSISTILTFDKRWETAQQITIGDIRDIGYRKISGRAFNSFFIYEWNGKNLILMFSTQSYIKMISDDLYIGRTSKGLGLLSIKSGIYEQIIENVGYGKLYTTQSHPDEINEITNVLLEHLGRDISRDLGNLIVKYL